MSGYQQTTFAALRRPIPKRYAIHACDPGRWRHGAALSPSPTQGQTQRMEEHSVSPPGNGGGGRQTILLSCSVSRAWTERAGDAHSALSLKSMWLTSCTFGREEAFLERRLTNPACVASAGVRGDFAAASVSLACGNN